MQISAVCVNTCNTQKFGTQQKIPNIAFYTGHNFSSFYSGMPNVCHYYVTGAHALRLLLRSVAQYPLLQSQNFPYRYKEKMENELSLSAISISHFRFAESNILFITASLISPIIKQNINHIFFSRPLLPTPVSRFSVEVWNFF